MKNILYFFGLRTKNYNNNTIIYELKIMKKKKY